MTLSRQVLRRIERTGELPAGMSWAPVGEPTLHAEDGSEIDTSVGTFTVSKSPTSRSGIACVILGASVLSGCATAPVIAERPLADRIPPSLLQCAPAPTPGDLARQSDVAAFAVDLGAAGEDCRRKVGAVRRIVEAEGERR